MFQLDQSRLNYDNLLGSGASGEIFPYQKDRLDLKWVVKRIIAKNVDELLTILPEIILGFACDHPRILPLKGYYIEKSPEKYFQIYMKLPRMKTDLLWDFKDRIRRGKPYAEQEIVRHFYSLACGLGYLHSKKIYHGDIKPANLLLSDDQILYIADIGTAKHFGDEDDLDQPFTRYLGTYHYSAPELLVEHPESLNKQTLEKAEVWSVGVVFLEICVFDFRILNAAWPLEKLQSTVDQLIGNLKGKYNNSLIALIKRMLNLDPKMRPSLQEIKDELTLNFSMNLDEDLLNLEKSARGQAHNASEDEVRLLNQQIKDMAEKFESQIQQLQQTLESALFQQKLEYEERIKVLVSLSNSKVRENDLNREDVNRAFEERDDEKLKTVIMELNNNCNELFTASEEKKNLKIRHNEEKWLTNDKITDEHLISLSKSLITLLQKNNLSDLPGLEIECWGCNKLTDKAFVNLIKTINDSSFCLQHLSLSFAWCQQLTDNISTELSLLIRNKNSQLKHLTLDFRKCQQLSDKALIELSRAISSQLLHLEHLNLDYGGCKELTDMALIELSRAISSESLSLQHLSLNFGGCEKLTDQSLSHFQTELRSLKELKLNFINCTELTDKGLESFMKFAQKKVEHLSLDFGGCSKLTDKGLERIALAISTLSSDLQHFNLNFSGCKGLTDEVLKSLAKALKNKSLIQLQYLGLDFRSIPNLSNNGVGILSTAIEESFENLQQLKLTFSTKGNITSEMKEQLKKKFQRIQKLEIV